MRSSNAAAIRDNLPFLEWPVNAILSLSIKGRVYK
jgi:hypothetical protein